MKIKMSPTSWLTGSGHGEGHIRIRHGALTIWVVVLHSDCVVAWYQSVPSECLNSIFRF